MVVVVVDEEEEEERRDLAEGLQPQPPVGAPERRVEAALQAGAGLEGGGLPAGPRRVLGGRELHLRIFLFFHFILLFYLFIDAA